MDFRSDKPEKEKSTKSKDAASTKRVAKQRRAEALTEQLDEDGDDRDGGPRQDVNIHLLFLIKEKNLFFFLWKYF